MCLGIPGQVVEMLDDTCFLARVEVSGVKRAVNVSLVASEGLFLAVKYAGAAYLMYLGLHALIAAWRGGEGALAVAQGGRKRLRPGKAYLQGLLSDLGNPKMAMFFASLLPQFATPGEGLFAALMSLSLVFSLIPSSG